MIYNVDNVSITEMCLYCCIWFETAFSVTKQFVAISAIMVHTLTICSNICNNGSYINNL